MTKAFWFAVSLAAPVAGYAADADGAAMGQGLSAYPTFCAIPPIPTDVRNAEAFKVGVVEVRQAGRRVVAQSGPETFGLVTEQTEEFGAVARAQAAYPRSPAAEDPVDTGDFAVEARRRATPPPRPRR
jgi:hypothetical protein